MGCGGTSVGWGGGDVGWGGTAVGCGGGEVGWGGTAVGFGADVGAGGAGGESAGGCGAGGDVGCGAGGDVGCGCTTVAEGFTMGVMGMTRTMTRVCVATGACVVGVGFTPGVSVAAN